MRLTMNGQEKAAERIVNTVKAFDKAVRRRAANPKGAAEDPPGGLKKLACMPNTRFAFFVAGVIFCSRRTPVINRS